MNKYNIGDKVWYAQRKSVEKSIVCPDCFGQKYLVVIKGDKSRVIIDCAECKVGFEPPRGYVTYWEQLVDVSKVIIQKIEITPTAVEYGFEECYRAEESKLFDNKEDAEKWALELAEQHNQEEIDKINRKEQHNRTWSWNACYHRRGIKNAERELAYHTAKLNVAKERVAKKEGIKKDSIP